MKIILNVSVKHGRIEESSGAEEFMKIKNKSLMAALAVLATFLWGSAFPSVKLGYEIFKIQGDDIGSKLLFAGIRFAAAGLMVLAVLGVQTRQRPLPKKGAFKHLLTLGILQTTIQYYFFYVGLAHTTGAKGSIINSFTAFFPVVLAPFFFKSDRLTAKKIIGCAIGLSGIVLINLKGGSLGGFAWNGEGFIVLAALSQSLASIYSKKLAQTMNVMLIAGYQLLLGGILLLIFGYAGNGTLTFQTSGLILLLYMAVLSAVAFSVWTWLLSHYQVSSISIYNLLIPVFGTLLSGLLLKENVFTAVNIASILLVCGGIAAVNKQ